MATDLAARRLQLLQEMLPGLVLLDPRDPISRLSLRDLLSAAPGLGVVLHPLEVEMRDDLDAVLFRAAEQRDQALRPLPTPIFVVSRRRIAEFAIKHRLASMHCLPEFVYAGGLSSYGPDRTDLFRRAASYVDKIFRGAIPGDLPVEQASKFQLVINAKTAKALGIVLPQSLLVRGDEGID